MGRSERPVDTRDFYTPALGALVTTGAATSHPATYGPRGCTAAIGFCPQLALGHGSERGSAQLQCACAFGEFPRGRSGYWQ